MKKREARKIAVDYLYNAAAAFTQISVKQPIDDRGTLSDEGYTFEDCEVIQRELEFLQRKLLALNAK